ncbi:hypothetical protein RYX56_16275 [Alkalihalophilus lindianensis]|uniref:RNA polymerase subunit sigma-70 n=1 Tax=Alkalihalophilus lindianensis TaxID=1630542 RepID=A0ABU3XDG6_9BACI|nr:hypothetical protein [Alkalihalophilus lindianensis]MDV2685925.1 hypothetical protein [Alkalihalophilus lindianensis]
MRSSMRQLSLHQQSDQMFHVDFHNFVEKEQANSNLELASEFGLSLRDVRTLKQKLGRN